MTAPTLNPESCAKALHTTASAATASSRRDTICTLRKYLRSATATLAAALSLASVLAFGAPGLALAAADITAGISTDVFSMDPGKAFAANDNVLIYNVYESLFGHDEKGKVVPVLATAVDVKDAGLTYEFTLRAGVKFHNGDPFTAEDVRFSWMRAISPALNWPKAGVLAANIADVEILGPLKVRVKLKKRDAAFLDNLDLNWFMVSKKHVEAVGDGAFGEKPMGTGPFKFRERKIKEYIVLEGNTGYWGKAPEIGKLTLRFVADESTRLAQIQAGEIDLVDNISPFLATRMKGARGLKVIQTPTLRNMYIMMNATGRNERMKNEEVRRALMTLVDTEKLSKSLYLGYAAPAKLNCGPGGTGCIGTPSPRIDAQQARAALTKAGFDFSRPLNFVGLGSGFVPQTRETVEALAQRFSEAGVQTKITLLEFGAWVQAERDKSPDIDLIFCMFNDYSADPSGRLNRGMKSGSMFSWYEDPALDTMIEKMNDFTDAPAREKHISGIYQRMNDRAAIIPLWATDTIFVARSDIQLTGTPNFVWPVFKNLKKSK